MMSSKEIILVWAAFQDNIRATQNQITRFSSSKQYTKAGATFSTTLKHKGKYRREVIDLLFNPASYQVTGIWCQSFYHLTSNIYQLFFDTVEGDTDKSVSQKWKEVFWFMEELAIIRNELKGRLASDRIEVTDDGMFPECAYCGYPLTQRNYDMNEVIITRGDVMRCEPEIIQSIMAAPNCVLVHHGDCHANAHTKKGQRRCIAHLLKYQSLEVILDWLTSIPFKSTLGLQAKNLVMEVSNG